MDVKEIVSRNISAPVDQEECIFVIEQYIKERKGVEVKGKVDTSKGTFGALKEIDYMNKMFLISREYFTKNLK